MATRTNPLVSAAVLASTAAIAVATPAIAPFGHLPSPTALQAAKVQLATFADVLSITPAAISDTLFNGWGEAISPNQDLNIDWAAQFVGQNLRCDFSCTVNGPSGIAYMYLDALINGNGAGIDNVGGILENPAKPYQPDPSKPNYNPYKVQPWGVSAVNYFFEGGPGPGAQYLLSAPFGNPTSPLYNPDIAAAINQIFQGAANVTIIYTQALSAIAALATQVPVVGPYVYGSIQAYLGYTGYPQGLSGILKYFTDVLANGGQNPIPLPVQGGSAAATLAAAATAAPTATTPADLPSNDVKDDAPAAVVQDSTPAVAVVKDNAPAVADDQDNAPVVAEDKGNTSAVVEVKDNAPAAETDDPVVNVPDVEPSTPPADVAPDAPKTSASDDDLAKEIAKAEKEAAKAESESSSSASSAGDAKSDASESKSGGSAATSSASESNTGASEANAGGAGADAGGSDAGSASDSGDSGDSAK